MLDDLRAASPHAMPSIARSMDPQALSSALWDAFRDGTWGTPTGGDRTHFEQWLLLTHPESASSADLLALARSPNPNDTHFVDGWSAIRERALSLLLRHPHGQVPSDLDEPARQQLEFARAENGESDALSDGTLSLVARHYLKHYDNPWMREHRAVLRNDRMPAAVSALLAEGVKAANWLVVEDVFDGLSAADQASILVNFVGPQDWRAGISLIGSRPEARRALVNHLQRDLKLTLSERGRVRDASFVAAYCVIDAEEPVPVALEEWLMGLQVQDGDLDLHGKVFATMESTRACGSGSRHCLRTTSPTHAPPSRSDPSRMILRQTSTLGLASWRSSSPRVCAPCPAEGV